jgi:hypothetical protein
VIDLAKRLVACKAWRWTTGLVILPISHPAERWVLTWVNDQEGGGVQEGDRWPKTWGLGGVDGHDPMDLTEWLPDLADPGTLGWLLSLVREARRDDSNITAESLVWVLEDADGLTVDKGQGVG